MGALGLACATAAELLRRLVDGVLPEPAVPTDVVLELLTVGVTSSVACGIALGSVLQAQRLPSLRLAWFSGLPRAGVALVPCLVPTLGVGLLAAVVSPAITALVDGLAPRAGVITVLVGLVAAALEGALLGAFSFLVVGALRDRVPVVVLVPVVMMLVLRVLALVEPARLGLADHAAMRPLLVAVWNTDAAIAPLLAAAARSVALGMLVVAAAAVARPRVLRHVPGSTPFNGRSGPLLVLALARVTRTPQVSTLVMAALVYTSGLLALTLRVPVAQRSDTFTGMAMVSVLAVVALGASLRGSLGPRVPVELRYGGTSWTVAGELCGVAAVLLLLLLAVGAAGSRMIGVDGEAVGLWVGHVGAGCALGVASGSLLGARPDQPAHLASATVAAAAVLVLAGRLGEGTLPTYGVLATVSAVAVIVTVVQEVLRWRLRGRRDARVQTLVHINREEDPCPESS